MEHVQKHAREKAPIKGRGKRLDPKNRENRPLVTDEPTEFEK